MKELVQTNPGASGTEIADQIYKNYKDRIMATDFKNVQRRVYDAINVLHALSIIDKDKNKIYYRGMP